MCSSLSHDPSTYDISGCQRILEGRDQRDVYLALQYMARHAKKSNMCRLRALQSTAAQQTPTTAVQQQHWTFLHKQLGPTVMTQTLKKK
jgi:hypothetical protein